MKQVFPYFGSKKRIAPKYPAPGNLVIEPFAGAAGYSVYWEPEKAILFDAFLPVVRAWEFFIEAGKRGGDPIRDLPILSPGETVPEIEGKELIGFWCVRGVESPRSALPDSSWVNQYPDRFWGDFQRERLAKDSVKAKHWEIHFADFLEADGIVGDWFIDPPYEKAGKHYSVPFVRFAELGEFCKRQESRVIVCEEITDGMPSWLPFVPFLSHITTKKRQATEAVWVKGFRSLL